MYDATSDSFFGIVLSSYVINDSSIQSSFLRPLEALLRKRSKAIPRPSWRYASVSISSRTCAP